MKTLRFGCIGCGSMGRLHTLNARFVPGMEVVAFADVDEARARQYLAEFGGEYATNEAEQVIHDRSLDAVLIQTGERFHPQLGIAAARAGKHIFLEKPIAVTVDEALELEQAVRSSGVKLEMGFCNRLAPMVRKAKELLPDPLITSAQCASYLSGNMCHHLDLIVHLFHEAPVASVYAVGGYYFGNPYDQHLPVDSVIVTLKFADGSQAGYIQHGEANNALLSKYSMQLFGQDRCVYLPSATRSAISAPACRRRSSPMRSTARISPHSPPRSTTGTCAVRTATWATTRSWWRSATPSGMTPSPR